MKILRNVARCRKCDTILESMHVHDWVSCECGNFVDGGREYLRRGGAPEDIEEMSVYEEKKG